jgi:MFS family permease
VDDQETPAVGGHRGGGRNRDLNIFWFAQILSTAGDTFSLVAIPLLVLHVTGSVAAMGLVTGLAGIASLATGVFAGVIADRFDRRRLLIGCDVARAVLYGLIPVTWLFATPIWLVYLVVPFCAAFAMLFQVTYVAVLPRLVDADQITRANGRFSASYAAAGIAGPVLAGILSGRFGATSAIAVDAATFAVSALGVVFVRFRRPVAVAEQPAVAESGDGAARDITEPFWRNLLVGARFLWRHPVLRSMTVLLTLLIFFELGLVDIIIYDLKHDLEQPDTTVGYVMAVTAIGTIVGALLVARVRRFLGFGVTWIGATMLCGLVIAALGFAHSVTAVAALATAFFCFAAVAGLCSMSLRQEVTPDALLGRVTAAYWTIHSVLGPVGAWILTAATAHYGVGVVLLVSGVLYLLIAAAGTFTPIRQPRPETLLLPSMVVADNRS